MVSVGGLIRPKQWLTYTTFVYNALMWYSRVGQREASDKFAALNELDAGLSHRQRAHTVAVRGTTKCEEAPEPMRSASVA